MSGPQVNLFDLLQGPGSRSIPTTLPVKALCQRNNEQQTPLAVAIRGGGVSSVKALLDAGAASTVFVQGYGSDSLLCTLPMTVPVQSNYFSAPEPLKGVGKEIIDMLDEKLSDYIVSRQEEKERNEKQLAAEGEVTKAVSDDSPVPVAPVVAKPPFDHFPSALKVGDIVRRGPGWRWGSQDEFSGKQLAGIVTSSTSGPGGGGFGSSPFGPGGGGNSNNSLSINWLLDQNDPLSVISSNSYTYGPPSARSFFVVDPSDPNAVPPVMTLIQKKNKAPRVAKFKVGDKVKIHPGLTSSSLSVRPGILYGLCLVDESKVGIVVGVSGEEAQNKGQPSKGTKLPPGAKDNIIRVMSLHDGVLCDYASSDLNFADGSSILTSSDDFEAPEIPGINSAPSPKVARSGVFVNGDRVKLRKNCTVVNGCLGDPSYKWVGVVNGGGGLSAMGASVTVVCNEARKGSYPQLSGNYPNFSYPSSFLMHESESETTMIRPLCVGDRVELADNFNENSGDGWCLGKKSESKVGIVLHAPLSTNLEEEQRNVAVASLSDPSKLYWFRSSWLKRSDQHLGKIVFKLGDRVQLEVSQWSPDDMETSGKCLGRPNEAIYGIVCGTGQTREGLARNIEVVAMSGPRAGQVSIYSARVICPATRQCCMTDSDRLRIFAEVSALLKDCGMVDSGIDVTDLLDQYGLNIWGRLIALLSDKTKEVTNAWMSSLQRYDSTWPSVDAEVICRIIDPNAKCKSGEDATMEPYGGIIGFTSPCAGRKAPTWTCSKESGGRCNGFVNTEKDSKCRACSTPAKKWKCTYCTANNKIFALACVACFVSKNDSDEHSKKQEKERAEKLTKIAEEAEESERRRQETTARELVAIEATAPANSSVPAGRFKHRGSFFLCGGNPFGFARCDGDGRCRVGVESCQSCGAGSHWTCCCSDDPSSIYCVEGLTEEQANNNAKILYSKSDLCRRVQDIPGYVTQIIRSEWSCPKCTSINEISTKKCIVCLQGENPSLLSSDLPNSIQVNPFTVATPAPSSPTGAAVSSPVASGFSFGAAAPAPAAGSPPVASGPFGTAPVASGPVPIASGFTFGTAPAPGSPPVASGFGVGAPGSAAGSSPVASEFGVGAAPAAGSPPVASGFGVGAPGSAAVSSPVASGFSFGAAAPAPAAGSPPVASGLFGTAPVASGPVPIPSGFTFGTAPAAGSPPVASGFTFGTAPAPGSSPVASGFGVGAAPAAGSPPVASGIGVGAAPAGSSPVASGIGVGATPAAGSSPVASSLFGAPAAGSSPVASGFGFGAPGSAAGSAPVAPMAGSTAPPAFGFSSSHNNKSMPPFGAPGRGSGQFGLQGGGRSSPFAGSGRGRGRSSFGRSNSNHGTGTSSKGKKGQSFDKVFIGTGTSVSKPLQQLALSVDRDSDKRRKESGYCVPYISVKKDSHSKGSQEVYMCRQCGASYPVQPSHPGYVCDSCGQGLNDVKSIACTSCSQWFCCNCSTAVSSKKKSSVQSSIFGSDSEDSDHSDEDDGDFELSSDTSDLGNSDELPDDERRSRKTVLGQEENELQKNSQLNESYFIFGGADNSSPDLNGEEEQIADAPAIESITASGCNLDDMPLEVPHMNRKTSSTFFRMSHYDPLTRIEDLCTYADKNGNTAAHHAAIMGLRKTYMALIRAGASQWVVNATLDSPAFLLDGYPLGSGEMRNALYKILTKRQYFSPELVRIAMSTPFDYAVPAELNSAAEAILDGSEHDAVFYLQEALDKHFVHAKLYRALFNVQFSYGPIQARRDLADYLKDLLDETVHGPICLDPLFFYVRFRLFKGLSGHLASYAKKDRLDAFDSLSALRLFPGIAGKWVSSEESFNEELIASGVDTDEVPSELEDDDYSELFPPLGPNDPETLWESAKRKYGLVSPSMDELMKLTGLKSVKHKAKDVCLTVLLDPPKDLMTGTSCNFTFIGNPGCGKTTVATLLAQAMAELKYRKNETPVLTSADEILGAQQPVAAFSQMVQDADGGTLFIDEAYLFDPAPKGKTQNDSNKVLNVLLKASEKMRLTTTFILAGYKEEMQTLLASNPGLPSRFPKTFTFDFEDYNEAELTKIISDMAKKRGYRFESQKQCGVPIARVLARRLHRGANKKGFGNGRECEKLLDSCIQKQLGRLVRLKERGMSISDYDYRTLTRADTVGERPRLEDSSNMSELTSMIGLKMVKSAMRNLMNLQLQNFDAEMRGEKIQLISLHRVFYGNPGTGKTTVAKLYGKMLKEFGFLSDGDIIITTPADLKGSAVGEGVARTKALLDAAKGKVLFIDEAYNLDPARGTGTFGAEVLDVILEKIEANAGSDMAVIMAGYQPQMEQLFRNCKNPGLKRRFNLSEAFLFEDFSDEDIRLVLKRQIVQAELYAEPSTLDFAISLISQKRMEDGFGNAGEAEQLLGRAKLRHSARLSSSENPPSNLKLLIREDFEGEVTSVEKARAAFADLENTGHVMSVLKNFEAMCSVADEEGRSRQELLSDCHMLFLGPPGSGKTTMGRRFAIMFKQLNLLPSDRFEYTTAGNLIDRFVGGTGNNTLEAMRRAKGGVLMIDEAYSMLPARNNFGGDIMQALLDNVTSEEFKGKLVVILSGYKEHVEELFNVNPGFQSRFDKKRIEFPEWDGAVATSGVVHAIERDGKEIDIDAKDAMSGYFDILRSLPNWASARDAMEWIKPSLDGARAERQYKYNQEKRSLEETAQKQRAPTKSKAARANATPPLPYSIDDVRKVFTDAIRARGGNIDSATGLVSVQSGGSLRTLVSKMAFKDAVNSAKRQNKLLVICYTNPRVCRPCEEFKPQFEAIANSNPDIIFSTVDSDKAEEVFRLNNVSSIPCTVIYHNGSKVDEILGCDSNGLRDSIRSQLSKQKKLDANNPPTRSDDSGARPGWPSGPVAAPAITKVAAAVAVRVRDVDPDDDDKGEDDDPTDEDVWTALEEACAELGYTLDKLKDMLSNPNDFPPDDLMAIVLRKIGSKKPGKVKNMLSQQRLGVLAKVITAIEEEKKAKSAEESKQQERVQAIGKCPMGFNWHKEGGGWRCGGGSHFVSDAEIENYMYSSFE